MAVTFSDFDHDNEPDLREQWQCPCPVCSGYGPLLAEPVEEDEGAWEEPSTEAMTPSEWVWAE